MAVGDTSKYGCLNGCIYWDRNQPGKKFCFKDGPLQAQCKRDMGKDKAKTMKNNRALGRYIYHKMLSCYAIL